MIEPYLGGQDLLDDIRRATDSADQFHVWWLGQSGFLVKWKTTHLLFDPYLSDSLTRKYATTDKPHVRMTQLIVQPELLDFVDVVTSSHNHTDHLDAETLNPLLSVNPNLTLVVPAANQEFAANRLQIPTSRITPVIVREPVSAGEWTLAAVPAAHEDVARDDSGRHHYVGFVVQFGPFTVYHSGDTVMFDGLVDHLRVWEIDLAILPINGQAPERRVAGNLWGEEAVELAKQIGAGMVIPCHFEMFEFNTATPDEFKRVAQERDQPYCVLRCGQRWTYQP